MWFLFNMSLCSMALVADGSASNSDIVVIVVAVVIVLALAALWASNRWAKVKAWGSRLVTASSGLVRKSKIKQTQSPDFESIIESSGYSYNEKKGIFYSRMDAWQRRYGYCRLYDEASAPLGMIIDCEPIVFEYDGKEWMIEFWKGQYDFTTGCEVGVYTASRDVDIEGVFVGTFYDCVSDDDMMSISLSLHKNGKLLFRRRYRHWWLTGFMLGEFSEPQELSMRISLTLKDDSMCDAFVQALYRSGYNKDEIVRKEQKVSLTFDKPRTTQPLSRASKIAYISQWKNKIFCERYQQLTKEYDTMPEKFAAMQDKAPKMFEIMKDIGRSKDVFAPFESIRKERK